MTENSSGPSAVVEAQQQISPLEDEPASPLQHASKLLNDMSADEQLNRKTLEVMNDDLNNRSTGFMSTPPPDGTRGSHGAPTSAGSSTSMSFAKLHNGIDPDTVVYPVGHSNGIDPAFREHIHNIPYGLPTKDSELSDTRSTATATATRKKSTQVDPGWTRPPQILLVEDDPTCRRIGSKFLYSFHCHIDSAVSRMRCPYISSMLMMKVRWLGSCQQNERWVQVRLGPDGHHHAEPRRRIRLPSYQAI